MFREAAGRPGQGPLGVAVVAARGSDERGVQLATATATATTTTTLTMASNACNADTNDYWPRRRELVRGAATAECQERGCCVGTGRPRDVDLRLCPAAQLRMGVWSRGESCGIGLRKGCCESILPQPATCDPSLPMPVLAL